MCDLQLESEYFHEKWINQAPKLCRETKCKQLRVCHREIYRGMNQTAMAGFLRNATKNDIEFRCDRFPDGVEPTQCDERLIDVTPAQISSILDLVKQVKAYGAFDNLDLNLETTIKNLNEILEEKVI